MAIFRVTVIYIPPNTTQKAKMPASIGLYEVIIVFFVIPRVFAKKSAKLKRLFLKNGFTFYCSFFSA